MDKIINTITGLLREVDFEQYQHLVNRVMLGDSYKYTQPALNQYPENIVGMFDYAGARSGKVYSETLFNGLQPILMKWFCTPIEQWEVDEAYMYSQFHGIAFDVEGWDYIVQKLGGRFPVRIKAIEEGMIIPVQNVLFTMEETDSRIFWGPSWMETVLMTNWYTSNVGTRSYEVRKLLWEYALKTQDVPNVDYQFNNFGARGSTNPEAAEAGGMAHAISGFRGSDIFSVMRYATKYYGVKNYADIIHSINATEHSSTTSWGKENEYKMIMNHIDKNIGNGMIAAVLDSYDYLKAVGVVCQKDGEFQNKINKDEYSIFVMRPDSGKPGDIIPQTLDIMEAEEVPFIINNLGYKVFNKMRIIWGDGINQQSMKIMLDILVERGYSSENLAFGSGGWLMQQHDRDTQGWAIKCSNVTLDEGSPIDVGDDTTTWEKSLVEREVFKDPITAPGKKSKRGKVTTYYNKVTKTYFTDKLGLDFDSSVTDMVQEIWANSKMTKVVTLDKARENANMWMAA